jgi:hypothetical protein
MFNTMTLSTTILSIMTLSPTMLLKRRKINFGRKKKLNKEFFLKNEEYFKKVDNSKIVTTAAVW